MSKFRKKPVVIEAFQIYLGMGWTDLATLPAWLRDTCEKREVIFGPNGVQIHTLEGWMQGNIGDWLIQGVQGEIYPCKPAIFEATYEPVEEE